MRERGADAVALVPAHSACARAAPTRLHKQAAGACSGNSGTMGGREGCRSGASVRPAGRGRMCPPVLPDMAEYSCVKSTKLVLKGAKEKRWGVGCLPPPPLPRAHRPGRYGGSRAASSAVPGAGKRGRAPPAALGSRRRLDWGQARPSCSSGCAGQGRGFRVVSPLLPAGVGDPLL